MKNKEPELSEYERGMIAADMMYYQWGRLTYIRKALTEFDRGFNYAVRTQFRTHDSIWTKRLLHSKIVAKVKSILTTPK